MKRITHEAIGRILANIAEGGTLKTACAKEGVSYHSAWKTLTRKYRLEYEGAKACGTNLLVEMALTKAMNSTEATAAADKMFCDCVRWLAERRLSQEYGTRQTMTVGKGPSFVLEGDLLAPEVCAKEGPNLSIGEYARA